MKREAGRVRTSVHYKELSGEFDLDEFDEKAEEILDIQRKGWGVDEISDGLIGFYVVLEFDNPKSFEKNYKRALEVLDKKVEKLYGTKNI